MSQSAIKNYAGCADARTQHVLLYSVLMVITLLVLMLPLTVQARDAAQVRQEWDAAFEQVLADPANVPVTMRYANLAIELEDYEAAIPALERLLFFNPELSDIKLELGIMYYNLGSYEVASEYLNDAKGGADVTPEITVRADRFLTKMGK